MSLKRSPFDFSRRQKWVAPPTLKFLSDNRRQTAFNTPSWPKDLDTKFHFNSHLHTSRPSLEKCLKGASIHVNVSFCTAFGIENLMLWKAAILWDVVSWMLSFALINGKKNKNKLLCRTRYLKSKPKTQTASNASENLSYACVERGAEMLEQWTGAAEALEATQELTRAEEERPKQHICDQRHF